MALNDGYLQTNPEVTLRDYQHASKLFADANFRFMPKHGFLFHVAFDFATGIGFGEANTAERIEAGLLVKSVDLPTFQIDHKIQNAYNRKNVIQSQIKYGDVNITFHDDSANLTNSMWQAYYEFYYGDSYGTPASYSLDTKYNDRTRQDWGFIPADKPFFNSIRVYSLSQHKYTGYTFVNPLITSWKHGKHNVGDDTLLENSMSISYETLLYSHGVISEDNEEPKYFTEIHYDDTESPLGLGIGAGPPESVVASGGEIRASHNIFDSFVDGDLTGGVVDFALSNNREGLKDAITGEATNFGSDIIAGNDVSDRYNFPQVVQNKIDTFQDKTKILRAQRNISGEPQVGSRDAAQTAISNGSNLTEK